MAEILHPLWRSIRRGLSHRCPACGSGALYGRYLKVEPTCQACGYELARHPADDGPAYLTIILIGHLIVAPMLFLPVVWQSPAYYSLPILLSVLVVVALLALPRVKGGWIGLMYALGVSDRDSNLHTADTAD